MINPFKIILRPPVTLSQIGCSYIVRGSTTVYTQIQDEVFPPTIGMGKAAPDLAFILTYK